MTAARGPARRAAPPAADVPSAASLSLSRLLVFRERAVEAAFTADEWRDAHALRVATAAALLCVAAATALVCACITSSDDTNARPASRTAREDATEAACTRMTHMARKESGMSTRTPITMNSTTALP
jgi:hypothetical protein